MVCLKMSDSSAILTAVLNSARFVWNYRTMKLNKYPTCSRSRGVEASRDKLHSFAQNMSPKNAFAFFLDFMQAMIVAKEKSVKMVRIRYVSSRCQLAFL